MNINVVGLLGVVFIVLKLCGVIAWSWVWVLCPFWIGTVIWFVIAMLAIWAKMEEDKLIRYINKLGRD